jgi:hypothetical protein
MYEPFWPLHAAEASGVDPETAMWPEKYAWPIRLGGGSPAQIKRMNAEH